MMLWYIYDSRLHYITPINSNSWAKATTDFQSTWAKYIEVRWVRSHLKSGRRHWPTGFISTQKISHHPPPAHQSQRTHKKKKQWQW